MATEKTAAHERLGKFVFGEVLSEIGVRFGRVYIYNRSHLNGSLWHLHMTTELDWLEKYRTEADVQEMKDKDKKKWIGTKTIIRTDWMLKALLGLTWECPPETFQSAIEKSEPAQRWVYTLEKAKDKVDWWFGNGCELTEKQLKQIEEIAGKKAETNKDYDEQATARSILEIRQKIEDQKEEVENGKDNESTGNT